MHMYCYQCQETGEKTGCRYHGACGKTDETANLQDLLIHVLKGIAVCAEAAPPGRPVDRDAGLCIARSLYAPITNTNFDPDRFVTMIREGLQIRNRLRDRHRPSLPPALHDMVTWDETDVWRLRQKSMTVDIRNTPSEDVRSLRELTTYALKGISAYVVHAAVNDFYDDTLLGAVIRLLAAIAREEDESALGDLAIEAGRVMIDAMALLDRANTAVYGQPEAVPVPLGTRTRPGILVTGHDLKDLVELLEQTAGTGLDVYTHSEMWAAHYYPALRRHAHLVGNYGNAWWMQDFEFASFNGPILVTSNCIVPVQDAYRHRIFTTGAAGYPGIPHIPDAPAGQAKDFGALIRLAHGCPPPQPIEQGSVVGGFTHGFVSAHLDGVLNAVRAGKIRRFVVMGGCDGRDPRRQYFTDLARSLPPEAVILTAGCAKYRYIKLPLGDIAGLPRVLDAGQCNDCYSLVRIALALQAALGIDDVNDLPIDFELAWYDQKAIGIILSLLKLGFRKVRMGPTLPLFLQTGAGRRFMDRYGLGCTG